MTQPLEWLLNADSVMSPEDVERHELINSQLKDIGIIKWQACWLSSLKPEQIEPTKEVIKKTGATMCDVVGMCNAGLTEFMLHEGGMKVSDREGRNYRTAMHYAVAMGYMTQVQILLFYGTVADVNAKDYAGRTPLHMLRKGPRAYDIASLLVLNGADVNAKDRYGHTPLQVALAQHDLKVVKYLHQLQGEKALEAHGYGGRSSLHLAVLNDNVDVLEYVITSRAKDLEARDFGGNTPLLDAVKLGKFENAKILLSHGADASVAQSTGNTVLHYALRFQRCAEMAQQLFEAGANLDALNFTGKPIMQLAIESRSNWEFDVVAEMAKRKVIGEKVSKGNMRAMLRHRRWKEQYKSCRRELYAMQKRKFHKNVSYLDVLTKEPKKLEEYAENEELVQRFKKYLRARDFPIYCKNMRARLQEAMKRREKPKEIEKAEEEPSTSQNPVGCKIVAHCSKTDAPRTGPQEVM